MQFVIWAAVVVAVVVVVGAVVAWRRRARRAVPSEVMPGSSREQGGFQVRLLEDDAAARSARLKALRGEVEGLRREASYAEQRGLDRRAERLQALIAEREQELRRREAAES